jgi:hypothetical protein
MGGKPAPAPQVLMPAPTAPTTYLSVVPEKSYQDLAASMKRIQEETGKIQEQRYSEVGTPAEVGARQAGRRVTEAAAYLAATPTGDKYLEQSTGKKDIYQPLAQAAQTQLTEAQKEYAEALKKVGEKPKATVAETPSWATNPPELKA